jgi:hypothetical protein
VGTPSADIYKAVLVDPPAFPNELASIVVVDIYASNTEYVLRALNNS